MRRYQPYPAYKDSGVEWLGEVPEQWAPKRLKYVANIVMGQSPPSDECNLDGEGQPFLQGCAEFTDYSPLARQYCKIAAKHAETGDILFSVRAPVGAMNVADHEYGIGRGLCAIKATSVDDRFLWWSLSWHKDQLSPLATGSTYEAVTVNQVGNLYISLPDSEQTAIATFLDRETAKLDTLIAKQEMLIELLQEKRQALISHAVTKGLNLRETLIYSNLMDCM